MGLGSAPIMDPQRAWMRAGADLVVAQRAVSLRVLLRGLGQAPLHLAPLIGCYVLYRLISLSVPRLALPAHAHATSLVGIERRLGIFIEPDAQRAILTADLHGPLGLHLDGSDLARLFSGIYGGGQLPWLLAMLLWLYLFRREHFVPVRNLAVAVCTLAITFAALYPVAPPRFALAGAPYRMVDVTGVPLSEQVLVQVSGFDPYASLPSVHVLWALLTGLGLFLGGPRSRLRYLAWLIPAAVAASVVITGNHYLLDVAASVLLFLACLVAGAGWRRVVRYLALPTPPVHRRSGGAVDSASLDAALFLSSLIGMLLLFSGSTAQVILGGGLLLGGAFAFALARRQPALNLSGVALRADWWCGMLLVIGTTAISAGDPRMRLAGSLIWVFAVSAPLIVRLRTAALPYLRSRLSRGASLCLRIASSTVSEEHVTAP